MRILHISDTHGAHRQLSDLLPEADLIIHSGDVSFTDTEEEVYDFLEWFCDLNYRHKIFVPGNHDESTLYGNQIEGLPDNFHYLCYSGVEIENVQFWGVPLFITDAIKEGLTEIIMDMIPNETDILITHSPPFGILDLDDNINFGCQHLLNAVNRIEPKLHLFGHVHAAYGKIKMGNTTFVNSSIMNEKHEFTNSPHLLGI